jgi:hypothetical protein
MLIAEIADRGVEMRQVHLELGLEGLRLLLAHDLVGDSADGVDVHLLVRERRDTPLIFMLIGAPHEMKRSDACFSAIILNSRSRYICDASGLQ